MKVIRQFIQESLLVEKVFGAQAFVYHGSRMPPDEFVQMMINDEFNPGDGSGDMYGKGLYSVYELDGTQTAQGAYGSYIYKLKINLHGCISFDADVTRKIYGKNLSPSEQAQSLNLPDDIVKSLRKYPTKEPGEISSGSALGASKSLKGRVKGIIYTGKRDGKVALIYDAAVVVPIGWKKRDEDEWQSIDRNKLRPVLRRAADDWKEGKYETGSKKSLEMLRHLSKLPEDQRVFHGNMDFVGYKRSKIVLPSGLRVEGSADFSDSSLESLPDGLYVSKNLRADRTKMLYLPTGLVVGGDLSINNSYLLNLPDNLSVGGSLSLINSKVQFLPRSLKVGKSINLGSSMIRWLPDNLHVNGNLRLYYTQVDKLPKNLNVTGTLTLTFSEVVELPEDLQVGGNIAGWLPGGTNVNHVPAHLREKLKGF